MKTKLFVDSTSNRLIFAIIKGNENIVEVIETQKNMTEIFILRLDNFLKNSGITKNDISEIYIVNGPGNFTGVRLGCVFANTLSAINNAKIFSISSCQFQKTRDEQLSIIDAKSNLFYVINDDKIIILPYSEIEAIAKIRQVNIINDYLNYDFDKCWNFNRHKFLHVKEVTPNYIKGVI